MTKTTKCIYLLKTFKTNQCQLFMFFSEPGPSGVLAKTSLKRFPLEEASDATPGKTRKIVKTEDEEENEIDGDDDLFFDVSDDNARSQSMVATCDDSVLILDDHPNIRSQEVVDLSTESVVKDKVVDESPLLKSPSILKTKKSVSDLSDEKSGEDTDQNLKRR